MRRILRSVVRGLVLVWIVCATTTTTFTTASNIHALPQNRRPLRGGSLDPTGPKLRKYAETDRMPSLFSEDEDTYDRYAACLAATEGLRRLRDRDMAEEIQNAKDPQEAAKKRKQIANQYVQNSGKVLRALGMSVHKFNELGKEIAMDSKLKEKIIEQAYLYRMAAAIHLDRSPLPEKVNGDGSGGSSTGGPGDYLSNFQRDKVQLFCESMNEIERLRTGQVERLKRALQVEDFPSNINISDPALLPFLNPRVRAVIEAFPLQAEAIVKKHGLESDEFNQMLHASKSNPIFRWKVQKHLKLGDLSTQQQPQPQLSRPASETPVPPPEEEPQPQAASTTTTTTNTPSPLQQQQLQQQRQRQLQQQQQRQQYQQQQQRPGMPPPQRTGVPPQQQQQRPPQQRVPPQQQQVPPSAFSPQDPSQQSYDQSPPTSQYQPPPQRPIPPPQQRPRPVAPPQQF